MKLFCQIRSFSTVLILLSFRSLRTSIGSADGTDDISFSSRKPLEVHIITPALYSSRLVSTYQYIGPGFDSALEEIEQLYPALNVTHHVLHSTDYKIDDCGMWNDNLERLVAGVYNMVDSTRADSIRVLAVITGGQLDCSISCLRVHPLQCQFT